VGAKDVLDAMVQLTQFFQTP